jgi:hypothetical protein
MLQAFKAPRKLEKVERRFRAISIQIILFATGGAVGHLFWSWPGKPYHGPSAKSRCWQSTETSSRKKRSQPCCSEKLR